MCAGSARDIAYAGRWTQGGRTVGNANAIGRAGHPHPSHPGNPATAGRLGRRPLRVADKRRYQHRGKQMRKGNHLRPSLGSPERGAVAALCAVTEGLVPTLVRRNHVARQPTHPIVGEGFHARPALVYGRRRFARPKWCAGCARGISYVGLWTQSGCTVDDAGAVGRAGRVRLTQLGNPAATVHRGRCTLRATA